jgi:serine/threonine protein phosphatase PrpC
MSRLLCSESRVGRAYAQNYDRHVVDETLPLFAVIDSECDDGTAGDIVSTALLDARAMLRGAMKHGPAAVEDVLVAALQTAKDTILSIPRGRPGHGGGAAVSAVSCSGDIAVIVHVGDCRLYVMEEQGWVRRTVDHTMLEAARVAGHPPSGSNEVQLQRGIILRAVGVSPDLEVDTLRLPIGRGCSILLCTRGAWMPLDPSGDAKPLARSLEGSQVASFVMDRYVRDGERDNATVVVAQLEAPA